MNTPIQLSENPAALQIVEAISRVRAGFPSPAQDHVERRIDLNEVLVLNPLSTFLFTSEGDSMIGAGIWPGDKLVVDRSIEAKHGLIVLACVDGEFTVKRLYRRGGRIRLDAENPAYQSIVFRDAQEMSVWGVVTWNLRQMLATRARGTV